MTKKRQTTIEIGRDGKRRRKRDKIIKKLDLSVGRPETLR